MAKCPYCGADNPQYVMYCGRCGSELPVEARTAPPEPEKAVEQKPPEPAAPPTPPPAPAFMRRPAPNISCVYCGAEQQAGLLYCPRCGKDPQGPWGTGGDQSPAYIRPDGEAFSNKSASSGLLVGGIMAILAGVLALGNGLLYTIVGGSLPYYDASGVVCFCGGLQILFGMGSLAGGIFAIQRKNFTLAVLGAVVGMLSLAFLIAFVLGLIAVILIASSKDEFRD